MKLTVNNLKTILLVIKVYRNQESEKYDVLNDDV